MYTYDSDLCAGKCLSGLWTWGGSMDIWFIVIHWIEHLCFMFFLYMCFISSLKHKKKNNYSGCCVESGFEEIRMETVWWGDLPQSMQ